MAPWLDSTSLTVSRPALLILQPDLNPVPVFPEVRLAPVETSNITLSKRIARRACDLGRCSGPNYLDILQGNFERWCGGGPFSPIALGFEHCPPRFREDILQPDGRLCRSRKGRLQTHRVYRRRCQRGRREGSIKQCSRCNRFPSCTGSPRLTVFPS